MITYPNAKINLGLNIIGKRPDGYHNIESVLYPVPLCDELEITASQENKFSFVSSGLKTGCEDADNLCVRAYLLLKERFDLPAVMIKLHKAIPAGSGLGGGSADAAFSLRMLNNIFNLGLENLALKELSASLGMDCPFFIDNVPALATGRGDILEPVSIRLHGHTICIVRPDLHISTAEAYAGITPHPGDPLPDELTGFSLLTWKGILKNQFEETLFPLYPVLDNLKASLYEYGALYASLSGSGSAVYGIFNSPPRLKELFKGIFYWEGEL
jgi:4-diphosphocytidyl-2-C-methyl-D-erythritol kinase